MTVTLSVTSPGEKDPKKAQVDLAVACSEAGKTYSSPSEAAAETLWMYMKLEGQDPRCALAFLATLANVKEREAIVLKKRASSQLTSFGPGLTMTFNKTGSYSSERASACMAYPDQVCIPGPLKSIQLLVMYPLLHLTRKTLVPSNSEKGFLRAELYLAIVDVYRSLYKEESETWTSPPVSPEGIYNRGASDGKYGIYGHDLEDLALQGVRYDGDTKEIYEILVSSHAQVLPQGDKQMQKINSARPCE